MKYFILLLAGLSLVSCLTPRERIYRAAKKDPLVLAEICADEYPVRTEFREGRIDTLIQTDTVREVRTEIRTVKGKPDTVLVDSETIYRFIRKTDTLFQENTALADSLRLALNSLEYRNAEARYSAETWKGIANNQKWWLVGLAILAGAALFGLISGYASNVTGWIKDLFRSLPFGK